MKGSYKETDMYEPVRNLLQEQGFIVRGEVKGCDIAAMKGDALWVVELKLSANISLLYQAIERTALTDWVFIAIPRPKNSRDKNFPSLKKLLKKLNLGLITVGLDTPVRYAEIVIFPTGTDSKETKKSNAVRSEISGRTVDTPGGITKSMLITAYRERCVRIACLLNEKGPLSTRELVKLGCEKDASKILRLNAYGWFIKVSTGVYTLSGVGRDFLKSNESTPLIAYYRMKAEEIL